MTTITRRGNKFTVTNAQLIDPVTQVQRYVAAMIKAGTPKITRYPDGMTNPTAKLVWNELRCATAQTKIQLVNLTAEAMIDYLNSKGKAI